MVTITSNVNSWPYSMYDVQRIANGDHSVFEYTKKSTMCEFCGNIITFHSGGSLDFCVNCNKDIPRADRLFDKLRARVEYHVGRKH